MIDTAAQASRDRRLLGVNILFVSVQYRADARQGFYRTYAEGNRTEERAIVYVVESAFHEMMLQVRPWCSTEWDAALQNDLVNIPCPKLLPTAGHGCD